ncbi:MAG TPA: DUF1634 domain-containing protein [Vicinamibacterales bacterium]|nr:DUF1634 domain-containing protein [Vicinamibacterales bacterium]
MTERDDEAFEELLGRVLRAGVVLAAVVVSAGGALYLFRHAGEVPAYGVFRGEPGDLRSIAGIVSDARTLSARGVIQLGLLLLIATPIARVIFALIGFARQKNWMYVGISAIVLTLLAYSLAGG